MLDAAIIDDYQAWVAKALPSDAPMNAAQLQGLCAAMAMAPNVVTPVRWLPWAFDARQGLHRPDSANGEELDSCVELMQRISNDMAAQLGPARHINLRLFHDYRPDCSEQDFCTGFLRGVELVKGDWAELLELRPAWMQPVQQLAAGESLPHARDTLTVLLLRLTDYWHGDGRDAEAAFDAALPAGQVWAHIEPALRTLDIYFPFAALALAQQHREHVAPHLVQALHAVAQDPQAYINDEDTYMLHQYAAALLGEWRDPRAFEPLLAMARWDEDTREALWDESLDTVYVRALASTCAGREARLQDCVEQLGQDFDGRRALMQAWKICVIQGAAPLAPWQAFALRMAEQEAQILRTQLPRVPYEGALIDFLVIDAADLGADAFTAPVRAWYGEGLMDTTFSTLAEFEAEMVQSVVERRKRADDGHDHFIYSAAGEIAWWASFMPYEQEPVPELTQQPYVRAAEKVGRNDACPCGSGRKYKKCHGAN